MAKTAEITAARRDGTGKGAARTYRREGRVPGILYGHGEESVPLTVDANELQRLVHTISVENTIVDLGFGDGGGTIKVLIREIQQHPFRDDFLHIDFFHVAMDEKISVDVPIVIVGVPTGVKNKGGVMDHQLREIEVYCLPGDIPEKVEIDVSELDIGDAIHVRDLSIPNVEIELDPERTVIAVLAPTVVEVEEEEEPEEEALEPELIRRERGEEGEEEEPEEERASEERPARKEKERE